MKMIIKEIKDSHSHLNQFDKYVEKYNLDKYTTLHYDKLHVIGKQLDVDDYLEYDIEDYEYDVDTTDVFDWLRDNIDYPDEIDQIVDYDNFDEVSCEYIGANFNDLVNKYNKQLLDYYEEDAINDFDENDYEEILYDKYHDDYNEEK